MAPWESGLWASTAFTACRLLQELEPSRPLGSPPPIRDIIEGCPLHTCLRYGRFGKEQRNFLDDETIDHFTALFDNSTQVNGTKSTCFRVHGGDDPEMMCSSKPHQRCCGSVFRPSGVPNYENPVNRRPVCISCLPYFIALGPEKTGTTDLYNRISLLSGVVAASQKETGWWSGGMKDRRAPSLAGYGLKYLNALATSMASILPGSTCDRNHEGPCDFISGEATPYYFYFQHAGLTLIPRWLSCVLPAVKLIVTLRDPVDRTYSDYIFFGQLQAMRKREEDMRLEYMRSLTPENFDKAMRKEVAELAHCFVRRRHTPKDGSSSEGFPNASNASSATPIERLIWEPPPGRAGAMCEEIRTWQLEKLAFYSARPNGRLLVSLYPMHLARWVHSFPCEQLLIVKAVGGWGKEELEAVAKFLDVDVSRESVEVSGVKPEDEIAFNRPAQLFAQEAGMTRRVPMLNGTRALLKKFFETHWNARFPAHHGSLSPTQHQGPQEEPCLAGERLKRGRHMGGR